MWNLIDMQSNFVWLLDRRGFEVDGKPNQNLQSSELDESLPLPDNTEITKEVWPGGELDSLMIDFGF